MTADELKLIFALEPAQSVEALRVSSFNVPKWSDLEKDFDPLKHSIFDVIKYPSKIENGVDEFRRIALDLQGLTTRRLAQAMFTTPVLRKYSINSEVQAEEQASAILEEIYRTKNSIDGENIERCKNLNAACEFVTVWWTYDREDIVKGETTSKKLAHRTYSAQDGYTIYANVDDNGEYVSIGIEYTDTSNSGHFLVYSYTDKAEFRHYVEDNGWSLMEGSPRQLEVFPTVHTWAKKPSWGGKAGTNLVEAVEEIHSYRNLHIKRNMVPAFTLDYGEVDAKMVKVMTESKTTDSRRIIKVGKGGAFKDVTWKGADEAVNSETEAIRNAFFEMNQIPDTSFANMLKANSSADNKELVFADSKAKAKDEGGEWEKMFYKELEIVKGFCKIMFPKYSAAFDQISIRSEVRPYALRTKKDNAEYVSLGSGAMSLSTQVAILGEVDDVAQEVEAIETEQATGANFAI